MSYDLTIYTRDAAEVGQLVDLVLAGKTLAADDAPDGSVTVVRGTRRAYSFTVDGPDRLEPEDVPEEVSAVLLEARYQWTVMVEGTIATEIPHAVRFARRLAQALDGAVVDEQLDEVWSRSKSRTIIKPQREERVETLEVDLYCMADHVGLETIDTYLASASKYLPEALPRRFGGYEPLQGKYADVGPDGFKAAWAAEDMLFFFASSGVCIGGNLSPAPGGRFESKYWSLSLTFHAAPFMEPAWRNSLRGLVIALADAMPVFYGSAEIVRGWGWSGRSLWADDGTEGPVHPILRRPDRWAGLPPIPTWWTYLGAPYADFADLLPEAQVTRTEHGCLFEAAAEPRPRDHLPHLVRWLPADLFAELLPNPRGYRPTPIAEARCIPLEIG